MCDITSDGYRKSEEIQNDRFKKVKTAVASGSRNTGYSCGF
jgi:hypothetical protein